MAEPVIRVPAERFCDGVFADFVRPVPNEVAVALTYGGSTQAVMMATPADLEDFGIGFSLTEGLAQGLDDIRSLDVIESAEGVEVRMRLAPERAETYSRRRRLLAGPTGCGLCGIESLAEAVRAPARAVPAVQPVTARDIAAAMAALLPAQVMNAHTRAVHAAGFWTRAEGLVAVREDVGRHNALDKLAGFLVRNGRTATDGIVVLTSRVSVEMIQKAAMIGAPVVAAVSAPTALAIRMADEAGITLVAVARGEDFEVFSHAGRLHCVQPAVSVRRLADA